MRTVKYLFQRKYIPLEIPAKKAFLRGVRLTKHAKNPDFWGLIEIVTRFSKGRKNSN